MYKNIRLLNIIMGGGGVKGIAYVGVIDALKRGGFAPQNIAGVSAGAIAASLAGAGYDSQGMWDTLETLEFGKLNLDTIEKRVPVLKYLSDFARNSKLPPGEMFMSFLNPRPYKGKYYRRLQIMGWQRSLVNERLKGITKSILTFCKEGCLFDGDILEEWIANALAKKGIRTFADLKGGKADESNPMGYKVRMTGVDCNRLKIVTLPDDALFYGIEPDDLEVAKAVRISTAVPFAFKPVTFYKKEGGTRAQYNLVDGGVLDSFPSWLIGNNGTRTAGFRLHSSINKPFSLDTPLAMLKGLITSVHDIGAPSENVGSPALMGEIDTGDISFLDFGLSIDEKRQLYESGKKTAMDLCNKFQHSAL